MRRQGAQVGGVFGADDAELLAVARGVGGVGFDAVGQGTDVFFDGDSAGVFVGIGLFGGGGGGFGAGDFGVDIQVVGVDLGGIGRLCP